MVGAQLDERFAEESHEAVDGGGGVGFAQDGCGDGCCGLLGCYFGAEKGAQGGALVPVASVAEIEGMLGGCKAGFDEVCYRRHFRVQRQAEGLVSELVFTMIGWLKC